MQKSGAAVPAYSAGIDDGSHSMDQSVSGGASVASVGMSSCGCCDQAGLVGAGLGADQIEQMISDKLVPWIAQNTETMDGKLAALHADLLAQQLAMAELATKQQASDAHQQQLADQSTSVDLDKYAQLVRNFIPLPCSSFFTLPCLRP